MAVMARTGVLPDDLLAIASRFITSEIKLETASAEERIRFAALTTAMVAEMLRAVRLEDGSWEDLRVTPEELDAVALPTDDLRMLELIALRRTTTAIATAASRALIAQREIAGKLGLQDLGVDDAVIDELSTTTSEEAAATVTGWSSFRGQPEGPVAGEDGRAVRPAPGDDAGGT